ncbi:MAG: DUF58 domain-containing protein [Oscillospiraceae bacterium]|nr:DUF58 domain-containing protein [Oscillospiraceae bacterium]
MTHIGSYIQIVFFAALFLIFISGDIGWALIYTVGGIIVISLALFLLSKNRFSVKLGELSGVASVNEKIEFEVTLKKKGFCVLPYVEVCIDAEHEIRLRTSLVFRNSVSIKGSFRANHSGLNRVRLTNVILRDFAGLVQISVPFEEETQKGVLPKKVDYKGPEVFPSVLPDDSGEAEEGVSVMHGGLPGYEHREYTAGDSLRRVDYKLSAKKQKLMVRLDESAGYSSTNLFIEPNALPACCDNAFALAGNLIMRGGTVKITHKDESFTAATPETLQKLREWLAFREFSDKNEIANVTLPEDTNVVFSGNGEVRAVVPTA